MMTNEKETLLRKGFAPDQMNEIEEGIRAGLDTTVYARTEFLAIQMRQIRFGLLSGVAVEKYASPDYDWFQMEEIRKGLEAGLDVEKYASPQLSYDTMRQIRKGLLNGIDLSRYQKLEAGVLRQFRKALSSKVNIVKYIKEGYDTEQLQEIRLALEKGVDIDPYLKKEFRGVAIAEICQGLERGLNVSCYASREYNWQQMREIRLGLENRIDTDWYANAYYSWQQMREIRLGLEAGIDAESYKSLMNTAAEMRRRRLELQGAVLAGKGREELLQPVEDAEKTPGITVSVSENEMQAYAIIEGGSQKLSREILLQTLRAYGIRRGIVESAVQDLTEGKYPQQPVLIVEGKLPVDGEDGWYEYFFRTEEERAPKLLEDGSVDYRNTEWFEVVEYGQKIAYYHTAGRGIDGYTVTGRSLPAKKGEEQSMLAGRGFVLLPDKRTYLAVENGKIDLKEGRLEITRLLVLDEMTIATGKVDFDGSVYIKGNVGSGVLIKAQGDIMIDGFVESSYIECSGSVVLKQGVNASGNGCIRAGKNVVGKFFEAVKIYADGDIEANYCMNSELYAEGKVTISGTEGTLVGGMTCAVKGMEAYNIGNHVGLPTFVKLGANETLWNQKREVEEEIGEVNEELTILRNAYTALRVKYPAEVRNTMDMYLRIESAIFTKEKQLDQLHFARLEMDKKLQTTEDVKAVIHGNLFEGVVMELGGTGWSAKSLQNVTVRKVNHRIAIYAN